MPTTKSWMDLVSLTRLLGVGFTLNGVLWLIQPQRAAELLGMPLLEGLGRSTQIGDFSSFFLVLGSTILAGAAPSRRQWLIFPALLLAGAATCRIIAWAIHGAAFAALFIALEIVGSTLLWVARRQSDA